MGGMMIAYKGIDGVVNTKNQWIEFIEYLEVDTTFEREVAEGRLVPLYLEINSYKIGKPEPNGIEWTAYARGEDDIEYMLFEFSPVGQLAKFTEESIDLIEEV
jgi:hypothetical protein